MWSVGDVRQFWLWNVPQWNPLGTVKSGRRVKVEMLGVVASDGNGRALELINVTWTMFIF